MTLVEKMIATAFFKGYSLSFDYTKYDEDLEKDTLSRRKLISISDIKYNADRDILVCGYIDDNYVEYRKFFLDDMSDIQVFKKIDIDELDI